jgi:hypothetical protein
MRNPRGGKRKYPPRRDVTSRRVFLGAGLGASAAAVLGGPTQAQVKGEHPDPDEVRRWSFYFNFPWHQFQPQWANRVHYSTTTLVGLATGAQTFIQGFQPQDSKHTLVIREVRIAFIQTQGGAGDQDPVDYTRFFRINMGLRPTSSATVKSVGRFPYRYMQLTPLSDFPAARQEALNLSHFIASRASDVKAGGAAGSVLCVVPVLVVGNRGEPVGLEIQKDASGTGPPEFSLLVTGWEILLPSDYLAARY